MLPTAVVQPALSSAAVDTPILSAGWVIPQLPADHPKIKTWTIVCPQIRKTPFELEAIHDTTFYELSKYVVKQFNLPEGWKALAYTAEGQPLLFNLDLMHLPVPKLDLAQTYYVIFTATVSQPADTILPIQNEAMGSQVEVKIAQGE